MAIQKELEEGDIEAVRVGLEALREAVSRIERFREFESPPLRSQNNTISSLLIETKIC
jgi:hypothetical protein